MGVYGVKRLITQIENVFLQHSFFFIRVTFYMFFFFLQEYFHWRRFVEIANEIILMSVGF